MSVEQEPKKPHNPLAFPSPEIIDPDQGIISFTEFGMTLRDYFAGQAISGILSGCGESGHNETPSKYVETAYAIADLMLAERSQHE